MASDELLTELLESGMIQQLRSQSADEQAEAVTALAELASYGPDEAEAIVEAGGIAPLAQLLQDSSSAAVLEHAADVLAKLSFNHAEEVAAETDGMLPTLVRLLRPREPVAQWTTLLVAHLAAGSPERASAIWQPALVLLLSDGSETEQSMAAGAVANLAAHGAELHSPIIAAGALPPLVQMLGSPNAQLQEVAALALGNLALHSTAAVVAAGAIPALVHILSSSSSGGSVHSGAAWAIAKIAREASADSCSPCGCWSGASPGCPAEQWR